MWDPHSVEQISHRNQQVCHNSRYQISPIYFLASGGGGVDYLDFQLNEWILRPSWWITMGIIEKGKYTEIPRPPSPTTPEIIQRFFRKMESKLITEVQIYSDQVTLFSMINLFNGLPPSPLLTTLYLLAPKLCSKLLFVGHCICLKSVF